MHHTRISNNMKYTYSLLATLTSCTSTLHIQHEVGGWEESLGSSSSWVFIWSIFCSNVLVFQYVEPNLCCFLVFSIRGLARCDTSGSLGSSAPCWSLGGNSRGGRSLSSGATLRCRTATRPREKPGCSQSYWLSPTSASRSESEHRQRCFTQEVLTHTHRVLYLEVFL